MSASTNTWSLMPQATTFFPRGLPSPSPSDFGAGRCFLRRVRLPSFATYRSSRRAGGLSKPAQFLQQQARSRRWIVADVMFRGTTKECLFHYAENFLPPKGARNSSEAKIPMANFIGVIPETITSWTSDRNKPLGISLLRLRFFLEIVGYDVIEMRGLRGQVNYLLAEMLAYGTLTLEEALEELDLGQMNSVLRIAHGNSNTSPERIAKIRKMHEDWKPVMQEAKSQLLKNLGVPQEEQIVSTTTVVEREQEEVDDESMELFAHLVLAITPLLERAVTSTTREQRNKLRKLTGDSGMFRLSKASSRLCSEKARENNE